MKQKPQRNAKELPQIKPQTTKAREKFRLDMMAQKLAKEDLEIAEIQKNLESLQIEPKVAQRAKKGPSKTF